MEGSYCSLLPFVFSKYKYGCRSMETTERFNHTSLRQPILLYTMLSRRFLVYLIMITITDFEEEMPPTIQLGEKSEEELMGLIQRRWKLRTQIYHISQSRWMTFPFHLTKILYTTLTPHQSTSNIPQFSPNTFCAH